MLLAPHQIIWHSYDPVAAPVTCRYRLIGAVHCEWAKRVNLVQKIDSCSKIESCSKTESWSKMQSCSKIEFRGKMVDKSNLFVYLIYFFFWFFYATKILRLQILIHFRLDNSWVNGSIVKNRAGESNRPLGMLRYLTGK